MEKERIILGVDPGTTIMGYGVVRIVGKKMEMIQMGVVHLEKLNGHALKLKRIFERTIQLVEEYKPDEVSLEAPFFGKNVQSMLKLGRAQGVAMVAGEINKISITEYAPKKIKQAVTGNGNASKEQLNKMIQKILNIKILDSNKLDASDALGAALCHLYQKSNNQTTKKSWKQYVISNPDKLV